MPAAATQPAAAEGPPEAGRSVRAPIVLGALALAAAYVASRVAIATGLPYYVDEGTYADLVHRASGSLSDLFVSYTLGREPLATWLSIPLVKLGVTPLTAVRSVSVLAGLLTVLVIGLLARRFGGARVAWVAATLCVVLPFFVVNQSVGTVEPLVTLIMAAALLLQIELAGRPSLRIAALLGLVSAAGTLTKESTKPALALLPVSLLCFDWTPDDRRRRLRTWLGGVAIVAAMVAAATLLLRASSRYPELVAHRDTPLYTVRSVGDVLSDPFGSWGVTWAAYRPVALEYIGIPLLVAAVVGAVAGWRTRPQLTAVLLAWIALPLLISMSFPTLPFPRHVMYLMPPAVVLMAAGIEAAGRWLAARTSAPATAGVCGVAIAVLLLPALRLDWRLLSDAATARYPGLDDRYITGTAGGAVWPAVADEIRHRARSGPVVVVDAGGNATVLRMLLDPGSRFRVEWASPSAAGAQFVVTDELPQAFIDPPARAILRNGGFRLARAFSRPRGGATVRLYER